MKKEQIESLSGFLKAISVSPHEQASLLRAAAGQVEKQNSTNKMLTTREAAAVLDVHPKTVLRYYNEGLLPRVRRNKRTIRWPENAVKKLAFEGVGA